MTRTLLTAVPALFPAVGPSANPTPTPDPSCLSDPVCRQMFELTRLPWLAEGGFYVLVKPIRILLVIVLAMFIRYLLHRMINRLVRRTTQGGVPTFLRPLRERIPTAQPGAAQLPERRRQRAEAIGSVLLSFVSMVVFSVAVLLVLGELGFDLAPLLASAGIAGLALGFGAQSLVKDLIAGLFMLLEDQYGVGDLVDVGDTTGRVEAIGLRITTIRDVRGVLWYIRNGEIVRVGNKSQGWALVIVDMPIGFAGVEEATAVLRRAAADFAADPDFAADFLEPPQVLGVEHVSVEGAAVRVTAKTTADAQFQIGRELRRRLADALEVTGLATRIATSLMFPRRAAPGGGPGEPDTGGGGTR